MAADQSTKTAADRVIEYPSAALPGIPPFTFSVPQDWIVGTAADSLAVVREPAVVDGFWVNAIIDHRAVPTKIDLKHAAASTWVKIKRTRPDVTPKFERMARFGANVVYLRGAEMTLPKDGRPISQLHALFFAPLVEGSTFRNLFQFIGTAPGDRIDAVGPSFMTMISTFTFT